MTERPETSVVPVDMDQIEQAFQPQKQFRTDGIINLVFFSLISIGGGLAMWLSAPVDRRNYAFLIVGILYLPIASISIWSILVWKGVSVILHGGNLILQGVFSRRELKLSEIEVIRWSLYSHGLIKVETAAETGSINLYYFENEERHWLIQYFRDHFPECRQENWPLFCHQIALPLRNRHFNKPRAPRPDDFLHTRNRWDKLTIVFTTITALISVLTAWHLQQMKYLLLPVLPLCGWFVRYTIPETGVPVSVSENKNFNETAYFFGLWSVVWVIIYLPFRFELLPAPAGISVGWTIVFIWTSGFYWRLFLMCRRDHQKDLEDAKEPFRNGKPATRPATEVGPARSHSCIAT